VVAAAEAAAEAMKMASCEGVGGGEGEREGGSDYF
jgi:hypothetical protein